MTQGEIEKLTVKTEKIFSELEIRIMEDIIRRIRENGISTASADWQISRIQQLGKSKEDIRKWIQDALKASNEELDRIFSDEAYHEYYGHEHAYKLAGMRQIPFEENISLQQLLKAVLQQLKGEYKNLAGSMGFAIRDPVTGKVKYSPLMDYYRSTMDQAVMDIHSGAFDYNTVLKKTINQMANSGLRWIDYDSGHRDRIEVAARRAVLTGFRQIQGKVNEQVADQLGTDTYEVSYHVGARPEHQPWQGKVWTKQQLIDVCGLGTGPGLLGWNCYHDYKPFVPGVSVRTYTDEQLEQMIKKENIPKEYNGKQYTTYEALQQQRKMERAMRAQRQKIKLLQEGDADPDEIILAKAKYQGQMQAYSDFSEKMKLPEQMKRINQDGLRGRFMPTKTELAEMQGESGISHKRIPKEGKYSINRKLIESNEYKRKYNGITGDSNVDDALYKYAKTGLVHRDGTNCEDLYILSLKTGKVLGKNVSGTDSFGVRVNKSIVDAVKNNQGDLIGLHTHPDGTPPTGSDFETAFKRRYSFGTVACSDGSVYTYGCSDQFASARIIDDTIEKFKKLVDVSGTKMYSNDIEAHLAAIESLRKDYGIWYETR